MVSHSQTARSSVGGTRATMQPRTTTYGRPTRSICSCRGTPASSSNSFRD